jgi:Competence protein CoiA-like family
LTARPMTDLLLPFARRLSDDRLVSPDEVPRGLACNCVCPGCEHPVLARQGTEREWHFAHAQAEACVKGYEASVHELAKQLVGQRKLLLLPALEAAVSGHDACGRFLEERRVLVDSKTVLLDECRAAKRRDEVAADLSGVLKGREVLVEITVLHRLMPEKRRRLVDTGIASFEIDLSAFKAIRATRERLERAIFEEPSNRRWIYHPRLEAAKADLQARLDQRLEAARMQWLAAQARYQELEAERLKTQQAGNRQLSRLSWDAGTPRWDGWHADDDTPPPSPIRIWRASFPPAVAVAAAQRALAQRTGLPLERIAAATGAITTRSQLNVTGVDELAAKWAAELEVCEDEVLRYLAEAEYTLP